MIQDKEQKKIIIIAGETSGDQHGANLVLSMIKRNKNLLFYGMGGEALKSAGVKIEINASKISIVGITEIFSKASDIIKSLIQVKTLIKNIKPDLLILIDFPEFNLLAAKTAKKHNIPILYYISPQIWAWRSGRIKKIKKLVDHIAVILPFEEKFYKAYNVPVTYVGHPLLDTENIYEPEDKHKETIVGLLPGSREKEVCKHLPIMLEAALLIHKNNKNIKFAYGMAPSLDKNRIDAILKEYQEKLNIEVITDGIENLLKKASLAIVASGTATLQTALFCVPMIIIYKMSFLSHLIGKALINVESIGLVNLIAGKKIVPELIQDKANFLSIAAEAERILSHPNEIENIKSELKSLRKLMGGRGASEKVANIALDMLKVNI